MREYGGCCPSSNHFQVQPGSPLGFPFTSRAPKASSSSSTSRSLAESRPVHGVCKCSGRWSLMHHHGAAYSPRSHCTWGQSRPSPNHPRQPLEDSGHLCAEAEPRAIEAEVAQPESRPRPFSSPCPTAPLPSWQRVSFDHPKPLLFYISIDNLTQSLWFWGGIVVACCLL